MYVLLVAHWRNEWEKTAHLLGLALHITITSLCDHPHRCWQR